MNSRFLPQNKAPFGVDPMTKFAVFCTKIRANNLATFVEDVGYNFDEESVMSIFVLRLAGRVVGERQCDAMNAQIRHL